MIPVRQTVFGYPNGNCMAACVASLLELPLEEMPVIPAGEHEVWNRIWDEWLRARGFARVCFSYQPGSEWRPVGYHLLAGPSPREITDMEGKRAFHVVVGLDGNPAHDPHPDDTFLQEITEIEIIYPLDPSTAVAR